MPNLRSQKQIAARLLKCGKTRIRFDSAKSADIAEAITAADVRHLINDSVIWAVPKKGLSNARLKHRLKQKKRGRRSGHGSRKGSVKGAKKRKWISRIRALRDQLLTLRKEEKIDGKVYRKMYMISKSGFFPSRNHLMVHLERNKLLKENVKNA